MAISVLTYVNMAEKCIYMITTRAALGGHTDALLAFLLLPMISVSGKTATMYDRCATARKLQRPYGTRYSSPAPIPSYIAAALPFRSLQLTDTREDFIHRGKPRSRFYTADGHSQSPAIDPCRYPIVATPRPYNQSSVFFSIFFCRFQNGS